MPSPCPQTPVVGDRKYLVDIVSGYIAKVSAEQERRESLRELLRDLTGQHGEPAAKDIKWAERALKQRRG